MSAAMRKTLYSTSRRPAGNIPVEAAPATQPPAAPAWRKLCARNGKLLAFGGGVALAAAMVFAHAALAPAPPTLAAGEIEAAVESILKKKPQPSPSAKAWRAVRGALVRVQAIGDGLEHDEYMRGASGSGVVIRNQGLILTNLHVISGASRIRVQFFDGLESDATVVSTQPESDLAVIKAVEIPDDLKAATLGSSRDLAEGEHVTAVGFPFGIGPSVSAGIVSGLGRRYQRLNDLIQFDAAANPGSSGGPLLNSRGEVVGVVTAIATPSENGGFVGIAFAVPIQTAAKAAGLPPF